MSKYCLAFLDLSDENESDEDDFLDAYDRLETALMEELAFHDCTPDGFSLPFGVLLREAGSSENADEISQNIRTISDQLNVPLESLFVLMTDDIVSFSEGRCEDGEEE